MTALTPPPETREETDAGLLVFAALDMSALVSGLEGPVRQGMPAQMELLVRLATLALDVLDRDLLPRTARKALEAVQRTAAEVRDSWPIESPSADPTWRLLVSSCLEVVEYVQSLKSRPVPGVEKGEQRWLQ